MKHIDFVIPGPKTSTLIVPPEFIKLCRNPRALDDLKALDMDAVHRDQRPERCMQYVGGTIGCPTFCTLELGHAGDCAWSAAGQIAWNDREEASRVAPQ